MIAKDSQCDEKVVANGRQANCSADARLLAQCLDQAVEVLGQGRWQNLGLPDIVLPVNDDREVARAHIGHRHPVGWDPRREMVSDSLRSCAPIRLLCARFPAVSSFASRHRAPARWYPADPVWLLGLLVIGWQIALSYADARRRAVNCSLTVATYCT